MKTKGFTYQFSAKELKYFLFGKKVCPRCGTWLVKQKCAEMVDGQTLASASTPLYIQGREVKRYFYRYHCNNCGAEYELSQLANN